MGFEQTRSLNDRQRGEMAGLSFANNVDVIFHPKSGDASNDFDIINEYYKEHFDTHTQTDDGVYMHRPKEAQAIRDKIHQETSRKGLFEGTKLEMKKTGRTADQVKADGDITMIAEEEMIEAHPDTLRNHGYLTVGDPEEDTEE